MSKERKVIYFSDELNDELSSAQITPKHIGDDYVYVHKSLFKRFTHFFWYRMVATPIAFFYLKIKFRHKIVNKKVLKGFEKTGYFLFGNHTQDIGDALIPTMLIFPKNTYAIVHANNVSMPFLGRVTPSMGALPLPDTRTATRNFMEAVKTRIEQGKCVNIYPEAHIWPYYTKIRPFTDLSFHYPARMMTPVFCFTNTYKKTRHIRRPKIVSYIDGPFFPDGSLGVRERAKKLRDEVYDTMCRRAELSDYEYIEYRKRESQ